jgi:hypothetical protein
MHEAQMAQEKLSKEERAAKKQARIDARVAKNEARMEARAAKAAERAKMLEKVEAERAACVAAIRLPATHQSWGSTRIRAWGVLASACASAAKRKRVTVEALAGARAQLQNVGRMSLDACSNIIHGR